MKKAGPIRAMKEFFHQNAVDGKIFKNHYFKFAKIPHLKQMQVIIGYFDPSFENSMTSDFKAISVWGLRGQKRFCVKRFTRCCEVEDAFTFMIRYEKTLPSNVGIIWYMEQQFITTPIKNALKRVIKREKYSLAVITDTRKKPNKYTRMVRMEPEYASGNVVYNIDEENDTDMVEGNNQVKGIEPGYRSPDDSPDADEGAWFYLDQHQHLSFDEIDDNAAVGQRERNPDKQY